MKSRIAIGIIAGLLAATALVGVIAVSYNAGRRHDQVVQVPSEVVVGESTEVVHVVGRGWGWGWGPGPGFGFFGLLVPVLLLVLVVLLVRRRRWDNWHRGPWNDLPPDGRDPRSAWLEDWHRRSHEAVTTVPAPPGPSSPPPTSPPPAA